VNRPAATAQGVVGADAGDEQEAALMERLAEGEVAALGMLYDRYRAVAYALALRITADAQSAEDVVQDAFLGVWSHARGYAAARGSVRTWLLSIVHHRAIDLVRRRRPVASLPLAGDPTDPALSVADPWPEVAGRLDRDRIRAALARLSDVQREALELAYFGGLTQVEIAERVGAPLGTVKSRLRLGLLALRRALLSQADEAGGASSGGAA
jgi:RNA polymerase sigma-70 factor (ECF subfamily)